MLQTQVLIAGYGPVGETLAALLGKAGIKTLVIERDTDVYRYPRAAHFDHEIMRIWQKLGIADAVLPWTRQMYEYEFRNAAGDILMRFDQRGVEAPSGWAPSYMFHQPAVEEALRKRVEDFPSVEVRLGTSLKSLDLNDDNGVTAAITAAAAQRDQAMIATRAAKAGSANDPLPGLPGISQGFIHKSPRAGELLPQTTAARTADGKTGRLDDLLGDGFWLLTRDSVSTQTATVKNVRLGKDIFDESGRLDQWFDSTAMQAVFVRPDRYVFGTGTVEELQNAFTRSGYRRS